MQLSDLRDQIGDWLQLSTARLSNDKRTQLVNMAQKKIVDDFDLHFSEDNDDLVTVADQDAYDLPDRFARPSTRSPLLYVLNGCERDVTSKSRADFRRAYPAGSDAAAPRHFTIYGTQLYIGPTPDAVYTLSFDFHRYLEDLVNDEDENELTANAWEAVLFRALSLSSLYTLEDARKPTWDAMFNEAIASLTVTEGRRRTNGRRPAMQEPG
jgi:hypothetical protein